jgi:hypothetical protein
MVIRIDDIQVRLLGVNPREEASRVEEKSQENRVPFAEKGDLYDLDFSTARDSSFSSINQAGSWPNGCDTDGCNGTGTYSTSCNGTCHSDCK